MRNVSRVRQNKSVVSSGLCSLMIRVKPDVSSCLFQRKSPGFKAI